MINKRLAGFLLLGLAVMVLTSGCAPRKFTVGYRLEDLPAPPPSALTVAVEAFEDSRPLDERSGANAGFLKLSTYDEIYSDSVHLGLTDTLIDELRSSGLDAKAAHLSTSPYVVAGKIINYRAIQIPPRSSFIPYVSYVTWMWTNDIITFGININLELTDRRDGEMLLSKTYSVESDTEVWVGFLNLRSRLKGFTREDLVNLLHEGLRLVMAEARQDIHAALLAREQRYETIIPPGELDETTIIQP